MDHFGARRLWDLAWIEDGCQGDPPPNTNADDAFGTYASDYLIAAIGVVATIVLLYTYETKSSPKTFKIFTAGLFVFTASGYGVAAVLHQIFRDENHHEREGWWKTSYITVLLGSMCLGLITNEYLHEFLGAVMTNVEGKPNLQGCLQTWLTIVVVGLHLAIIIQTAIEPNLVVTGMISGVTDLYAMIVSAVRREWTGFSANLFKIIGFVVQLTLSNVCGGAAYADCFRDCPLPAPYFNHNALFHVLYAVGLILLAANMGINTLTKSAPLYTSFMRSLECMGIKTADKQYEIETPSDAAPDKEQAAYGAKTIAAMAVAPVSLDA